jgi:hypothetical protein
MGFRCSFVVSQTEPTVLLKRLGFEVIGEVKERPDNGRWCAKLVRTGWTVIFANDFSLPAEVQDQIADLSQNAIQFIGILSETSMAISLSKYAGGKEDWAIDWVGDQGFDLKNLSARGSLPSAYENKKKDALEAQASDQTVDYLFDIPVALLADETGFRYNMWIEAGEADLIRLLPE